MVSRHARKRQILAFIWAPDEATAREVADACDIGIHNARTLLARYHRYGLLNRYTGDRSGTRVYTITMKGIDRLMWLQAVEDALTQRHTPEFLDDRPALHRGVDRPHRRQLTSAQLREWVHHEEKRLRVLEAELSGWRTSDWTEYLRLRFHSRQASSPEDQ